MLCNYCCKHLLLLALSFILLITFPLTVFDLDLVGAALTMLNIPNVGLNLLMSSSISDLDLLIRGSLGKYRLPNLVFSGSNIASIFSSLSNRGRARAKS